MTLVERLQKKQRQHLLALLVIGLFNLGAYLAHSIVLVVISAALVFALAVFAVIDLYRSARCPKCGHKFWLVVSKIAPLLRSKPQLDSCPSCGYPTDKQSVA